MSSYASKSHSGTSKGESRKCSSSKRSGSSRSRAVPLKCLAAIYTPLSGAPSNYFHFAFVVRDENKPTLTNSEWHKFQVVQNVQDGPFTANYLARNPTTSTRCLPLEELGKISGSSWGNLVAVVDTVAVPGESSHWNCQDYVFEIWAGLLGAGVIDQNMWQTGYNRLSRYYGQDFGSYYASYSGDVDIIAEEAEPEETEPREYKSAEYVVDSDEE